MRREKNIFFAAHGGSSMVPVLPDPCIVEIEPLGAKTPRPGDVIYFICPTGGVPVAHRVLAVEESGITTRGDNTAKADPWVLGVDAVLGRVRAVWEGKRRRVVHGGGRGCLMAKLASFKRYAALRFSRPFRRAARFLGRRQAVRRALPPSWRPRVLAFSSAGRRRLRLMMGGIEVGHYSEADGIWILRAPYRFLVDKEKLPLPEKGS